MFYVLSKLLDILLSPLTWGLGFVALAIPWRRPRRRTSWKRRRIVGLLGIGVLLFFSVEPVSNRLLYRLEHATTSTYRSEETYDVVVLLGGIGDERVMIETGQPSYNENVERLVATHRVLADGRARFAIVTGAAVDPALVAAGEARVLARQLVLWGIDPSRVIIEEEARNTHENAVYSQRIAKERGFVKALMVTSAFHMRRAEECFEAIGMNVDTLAVDYRAHSDKSPGSDAWLPRASFLSESTMTLREMTGFYIYRWKGYTRARR